QAGAGARAAAVGRHRGGSGFREDDAGGESSTPCRILRRRTGEGVLTGRSTES
ncbi:unnamed protein product, partial [Ascophyllum nodosum]